MTASTGPHDRRRRGGGRPVEAGLSWTALAAAAGAVLAWAACCALPMSLALAGLGLGGLSWFAGQRTWITLAALGAIGAGWLLTWRRARICRASDCAAPGQRGVGLLTAATLLALVALAWQPFVEPLALALILSARG